MFTLYIPDFFDTARQSDKSYMINHVVYFGLKALENFYENKTCIFQLVFLLTAFGEQIVILMFKETYLVKYIQ